MSLLQALIAAKLSDSGSGGGSVTPASIVTATGAMTAEQKAQTSENIGVVKINGIGEVKPNNIEGVTVSGGNVLNDATRLYCTQPGHIGGSGYATVSSGSAVIANDDEFCAFLIPVKQNTHYTSNNSIRFAVLLKNLSTRGTSPIYYDTVVGSALANITSFDTGEADHIIVSWNFTKIPIENMIISEGNTPFETPIVVLPDWLKNDKSRRNRFASVKSATMGNGAHIEIEEVKNNLRKGERIVVSGDITSFTKVSLNYMYSSSSGTNFIEVSDTYITVNNPPISHTAHGLTMTNNFTLEVEQLDDNTAKITLTSNGASYTHTYDFVRQSVGYPMFSVITASLTNVKMSWTCKDLCKNIWVFGDSYVGYSNTRWPYYLKEQGYDKNILLDGFPGEGSVNGRVSFYNLLKFGVPKFAVWCLGMNDRGDSSSAPSENWTSGRELFLLYCRDNDVTPVFGTIPTVPTINHEQKNAWIRSSGYLYIDFAKAVGAQADGTWFSGMLASDGVHPTENGARALFDRVLLDLPEIMIDNL